VRPRAALSLLLLGALIPSVARAQDPSLASLRGIVAVAVQIDKLGPDAEESGFDQPSLQTAVEGRLRKAGIRIYSAQELKKDARSPILHLKVTVHRDYSYRTYGIHALLSLSQTVYVKDLEMATMAITWSKGYLITATPEKVADAKRDIEDMADSFAADLLAARKK